MVDSDSEEEPHRMGLARLAKARTLSLDLVEDNENKATTDVSLSTKKEENPKDQCASSSSTSSGFVTQDSESKTKFESLPTSPQGENIPIEEPQVVSSKAKNGQDAPKKSFLQSLHQKSIKRINKKKNQVGLSSQTSCSSSPGSSVNLKVPERNRSKSLTRLSNALSSANKVGITPMQSLKAQDDEEMDRPSSCYELNKLNISSVSSTDSCCSSSENLNSLILQRNTQLVKQRSFSLGRLNDLPPPLTSLSSAAPKQKNFLVGGQDSLLGISELERYFPDRKITLFLATWNMNSNAPPSELEDFLLPDDVDVIPDIYVIATQESDDDKTEWQVKLQTTIGPSHVLLTSSSLGILHLCIFLRRDLIWFCSVPEDDSYSLRPGTYFKTKGAIAISFQFFGSRLLFINTHLFAHEEKLTQRIQNYKNIIKNLDLPKNLHVNKSLMQKDLTQKHDIIFWLGDLNFRIVGDRGTILKQIDISKKKMDYFDLLYFDQLHQSRHKGEIFHGFDEAPIHFAPTFKFDVGTDNYDSSYKQRVPSYTDRILFKSTRDPIKCLRYDSFPLINTSDHKPVWGLFSFKIRPGKDNVPLAAGLFQRDIYLEGIKRRRRFYHQSSKNCQLQ